MNTHVMQAGGRAAGILVHPGACVGETCPCSRCLHVKTNGQRVGGVLVRMASLVYARVRGLDDAAARLTGAVKTGIAGDVFTPQN